MMINPTPCHNCLILPICKSKVSNYRPLYSTRFVQASMLSIRVDCSLFYQYIKPTGPDIHLCKYRRRIAVHYLTGIDIGEDEDLYGRRSYTIEELYDMCDQEEITAYDRK